eukprot:5568904-Amphidinium_carterae.1
MFVHDLTTRPRNCMFQQLDDERTEGIRFYCERTHLVTSNAYIGRKLRLMQSVTDGSGKSSFIHLASRSCCNTVEPDVQQWKT